MKNKTSILTLALLCAGIFSIDSYADRGDRKRFVGRNKKVGLNKGTGSTARNLLGQFSDADKSSLVIPGVTNEESRGDDDTPKCPTGQYLPAGETDLEKCESCGENVASCDSKRNVIKCAEGFSKEGNKCVSSNIAQARNDLSLALSDVSAACVDIESDLKAILGLDVASATSAGVSALAATGGVVTMGIKTGRDKKNAEAATALKEITAEEMKTLEGEEEKEKAANKFNEMLGWSEEKWKSQMLAANPELKAIKLDGDKPAKTVLQASLKADGFKAITEDKSTDAHVTAFNGARDKVLENINSVVTQVNKQFESDPFLKDEDWGNDALDNIFNTFKVEPDKEKDAFNAAVTKAIEGIKGKVDALIAKLDEFDKKLKERGKQDWQEFKARQLEDTYKKTGLETRVFKKQSDSSKLGIAATASLVGGAVTGAAAGATGIAAGAIALDVLINKVKTCNHHLEKELKYIHDSYPNMATDLAGTRLYDHYKNVRDNCYSNKDGWISVYSEEKFQQVGGFGLAGGIMSAGGAVTSAIGAGLAASSMSDKIDDKKRDGRNKTALGLAASSAASSSFGVGFNAGAAGNADLLLNGTRTQAHPDGEGPSVSKCTQALKEELYILNTNISGSETTKTDTVKVPADFKKD